MGRMARRLIVRLFADTVRYGEALELQARSFAFASRPPGAPRCPLPFADIRPASSRDAQESIASARRAGTVADTLLVLQVRLVGCPVPRPRQPARPEPRRAPGRR